MICLTNLKQEPCDLNPDGTVKSPDQIVKTKGYMMTPCNHKYHKKCLLQWMQMKMECPTCRARLPRIEAFDGINSDSDSDNSDLDI